MPAKATWSGIWNPSVCAASMPATSAPARMRWRSTITARPMRSLRIRPTPATLMHRLIEHFQDIAPTWLLLETDWAATLQAAPYLPHCSDIVTIGRVKWIEGSKHTGKDNHAWYRFDARHKGGPVFHRRDQGAEVASTSTRRSLRAMRQGLRAAAIKLRGSARRRAGSRLIAGGLA